MNVIVVVVKSRDPQFIDVKIRHMKDLFRSLFLVLSRKRILID